MLGYSAILDRALQLAAVAHREQQRKGTAVPYIVHPAHAAMILIKYQFPEDAVVAAVLHDVIEDTEVSLGLLQAEFGDEVARIVDALSERKHAPGSKAKLPWRTRKEEQLQRLKEADALTAAVKIADALHNCQAMLRDLQEQGGALWQRFTGSREDQIWYYTTLAALLRERLGSHALCDEFDQAVSALAGWQERA
jgi:(p)ppGpp synthase/HD superfamily hydrolase